MKCFLYIGLFVPLLVYTNVHGLKCVRPCAKANCRPSLVVLKECKGGLALGLCGCCVTCAKVEHELCTPDKNRPPFYGRCDTGLFCKSPYIIETKLEFGICTKLTTGYAVGSDDIPINEDIPISRGYGDVKFLSTQKPVASGSGIDDDEDSEIIIYSLSTQKPTGLQGHATIAHTDFGSGEEKVGTDQRVVTQSIEPTVLPETMTPPLDIYEEIQCFLNEPEKLRLPGSTSTFIDTGSGDDDSDGEISAGLHTTRKPTVLQKHTTTYPAGSGSGDEEDSKVTTAELPTTQMPVLWKKLTTTYPAGSGSGDDEVSKVTTTELPTTQMPVLRTEHITDSPQEVTTDTEMPPTETSTVDPNIIMFA